jgi:carbon monoxide dehydrogenase subunit G
MTGSVETGYEVTAVRSVAGAEMRMTGRFALSEVRPGRGCLLTGSGEAAGAGGARGTCRVALAPDGAGTRLSWDIAAETEGRLARLPYFVVSMAARKVADGFVARFAAALEGREPAPRTGLLGRLWG